MLLHIIVLYFLETQGYNIVHDFICGDGTQIKLNQVCDGSRDCPDSSDERRRLCYHLVCPENTFRCYYGACVNKSVRCDGNYQCADKSDESNCGHPSCSLSEFQCSSLECIPQEKLCNGYDDCLDRSDENSDICEEVIITCPENTHHCKYGGCIKLEALCNGFNDCLDGSDESELVCKNLKSKRHNLQTFCPPLNLQRSINKCELKEFGWIPCESPLPVGTIVQSECKQYYRPINNDERIDYYTRCQSDGTWSRQPLKCEPAAHCVWSVAAQTLKVALGKYYRTFENLEEYTQIFDVDKTIQQPLYQDLLGNYGSDIAILILNESVIFSEFVSPVCIDWTLDNAQHLEENSLGMVVGMGITENDTYSDTLKATYLPVVGYQTCINSQVKDFKKYVTFTTFCAGWQNGTGVCNGDSGGGLVFPKFPNNTKWILEGIVSVSPRRLGTSYCNPKYFTIFTRVGMYINWIKEVVENIELGLSDNNYHYTINNF
ncbi:hypothetical protein FQR65_LT09110 [Abscondita terminalis]|nr:hypothetical protein FQR65_LT09110 [Abscondita terminalis]